MLKENCEIVVDNVPAQTAFCQACPSEVFNIPSKHVKGKSDVRIFASQTESDKGSFLTSVLCSPAGKEQLRNDGKVFGIKYSTGSFPSEFRQSSTLSFGDLRRFHFLLNPITPIDISYFTSLCTPRSWGNLNTGTNFCSCSGSWHISRESFFLPLSPGHCPSQLQSWWKCGCGPEPSNPGIYWVSLCPSEASPLGLQGQVSHSNDSSSKSHFFHHHAPAED